MSVTNDTPMVDEAVWNAWLQKSRLRELRTVRRMKVSAGVVVLLAAIAAAVYRFI